MSSESLPEQQILEAARHLPTAELRAQYLRRACGGNHELLRRVESTLDREERRPAAGEPGESTTLKSHVHSDIHVGRATSQAAASGVSDHGALLSNLFRGIPQAPDRYTSKGEVAHGGMGVVLKVRDRNLNRDLAMKILHENAQGTWSPAEPQKEAPLDLVRFLEEAQVTAQLDHPGIVPVHDIGIDEQGRVFFTMHLVRGRELGEIFELARQDQEGWNLSRAVGVLVKTCQAMGYAHSKGVIHRDLKPRNIMVGRFGEVFVMDWGLAKVSDRRDIHDLRIQRASEMTATPVETVHRHTVETEEAPLITMDGSVIGTPAYMPPEQANGWVEAVDKSSDVYALGAILYNLLAGRAPYIQPGARMSPRTVLGLVIHGPPQPIYEINPHAPAELVAICEKAMAREKSQRYPSSLELAEDLQAWIDHRVVKAYETGAVAEAKSWVRRNRALAGASAAAAALLTTGLLSVLMIQRNANVKLTSTNLDLTAARRQIDEQLKTSRTRQTELTFAKGLELAERGSVPEGLMWMLESLKVAPESMTHFARMVRMNLSAWTRETPEFMRSWEEMGNLQSIAFSPDNRMLAAGFKDGSVRFLDAELGTGLREPLRFSNRMIASLDFHPGGKILAVGLAGDGDRSTADGSGASQFDSPSNAYLWNLESGTQFGPALPHNGGVHDVCFNPSGTLLLTREYPGTTLRLWNPATGELARDPLVVDRHQLAGHVEFSPNGKLILVSMLQRGLGRIVDVDSFSLTKTKFPPNSRLRTFGRDGGVIVRFDLTESECALRSLDALTGQPRAFSLSMPTQAEACRFTPDGRNLVVQGTDSTVRSWEFQSGRSLWPPMPHGTADFLELDCEARFAVTHEGQWRLPRTLTRPGAPLHQAAAGGSAIRFGRASDTAVEYHWGANLVITRPDGPQPLTTGARLWNLRTGQPVGLPLRHRGNAISDVALSPDGRLAATCAVADPGIWEFEVGSVCLWDTATGKRRLGPLSPSSAVAVLAFSPDGRLLAGGGYDGKVRFWDTQSGEEMGLALQVPEIVFCLKFSPDGTKIAAGTTRARINFPHVRLWDVKSRRPSFDPFPSGDEDWVLFLEFTPDSQRLLAGSNHQTEIRDTTTGRALFPANRQLAEILAVRLSSDGSKYATGDRDGVIRLYDSLTGAAIGQPMKHSRSVQCMAFSPDGALLAAGSAEGSARLWDIGTSEPVGPPLAQALPIFGVAFAPDGRSFVSTAQDGATRVWPVPGAITGTAEELSVRMKVRTRLQLEQGVGGLLTHTQWTALRQQVGAPEAAPVPLAAASKDIAWHAARAADAEQDGDWIGALWHLDQLVRLDRGNWVHHARRGRALSFRGEFREAEDAYARAKQLADEKGGVPSLANWFRQCAFDSRERRKWKTAVWYLGLLIEKEPNDWQLYADRSEAFGELGEAEKRRADFARALELSAGQSYVADVAAQNAENGKWKALAEIYSQAGTAGWLSLEDWRRYAVAQLKANEPERFRQNCQELLHRVGATNVPPTVALAIARICMIGPCDPTTAERALRLLEFAVTPNAPNPGIERRTAVTVTGGILCRAGRYKEALEQLSAVGPQDARKSSGLTQHFLALARKKLGQPELAGQIAGPLNPAVGDIWERAEIELLQQEFAE